MSTPLPLLVLALLAGAPAAPPAAPDVLPREERRGPEEPARVHVREGRATLLWEGGRRLLLEGETLADVRGTAFLKVGAGSIAELSFRERASLRIEGPAEVEWDPPSADEGPVWRALAFHGLDLEVRRGDAVVVLVRHRWQLQGTSGALQVTRAVGDAAKVHNRGGRAFVLRRLAEEGEDPGEPVVLASGERRTLPPPASR
jgi:hypothetical protein